MKAINVPRSASAGYAAAPAFIVRKEAREKASNSITPDLVQAEEQRFEDAVKAVQAEFLEISKTNDMFIGHYALAADQSISKRVALKIEDQLITAGSAVLQVKDELVAEFQGLEDEFMRERSADIDDVMSRILRVLKGERYDPYADMDERSIIVAHNLFPSDTAMLDFSLVAGIITEAGGVTSHISIIASDNNIPCIVGAGQFLDEVKDGDRIVIDAFDGTFWLEPDDELFEKYLKLEFEYKKELEAQESRYTSGTGIGAFAERNIRICANAGSIDDIRTALKYPIYGIGLFRTEFLFMKTEALPTEEEQYSIYKTAADMLEGRQFTIRTADIGADKSPAYYKFPWEDNPALGYRGIRVSLKDRDMFRTQLRAILRASAGQNFRIMFPMVSTIGELEEAKSCLYACMEELDLEGIPYDKDIKIGIMVETPASVVMAEEFAKRVDFFSIGTNDLTQYILAADRMNTEVSELFDSFDPAVLRAIKHTIDVARKYKIKVSLCGEFAASYRACGLLCGMGLDGYSVTPKRYAGVRAILENISYEDMRRKAEKALAMSTAAEVLDVLAEP